MRIVKKIVLKIFLKKKEREVIIASLRSCMNNYKKHGASYSSEIVRRVLDSLFYSSDSKKNTYSKEEVHEIIKNLFSYADSVSEESFDKGVKEGLNLAEVITKYTTTLKPPLHSIIQKGTIFDKSKCDHCANKDDCITKKMIFEEEANEDEGIDNGYILKKAMNQKDYGKTKEKGDKEKTIDEVKLKANKTPENDN